MVKSMATLCLLAVFALSSFPLGNSFDPKNEKTKRSYFKEQPFVNLTHLLYLTTNAF